MPACQTELGTLSPIVNHVFPVTQFSGVYPAGWPDALMLPRDALLAHGNKIHEQDFRRLVKSPAPILRMTAEGLTRQQLDSFIEQCTRSLGQDWKIKGQYWEYRHAPVMDTLGSFISGVHMPRYSPLRDIAFVPGQALLPSIYPLRVRLWCTKSHSDGSYELVIVECQRCGSSRCQWRYFRIQYEAVIP